MISIFTPEHPLAADERQRIHEQHQRALAHVARANGLRWQVAMRDEMVFRAILEYDDVLRQWVNTDAVMDAIKAGGMKPSPQWMWRYEDAPLTRQDPQATLPE